MWEYAKYLFKSPDGKPSKTAFYAFIAVFSGIGMALVLLLVETPMTKALATNGGTAAWALIGSLVSIGLGAYIIHNHTAAHGRANGGMNHTTGGTGASRPGVRPKTRMPSVRPDGTIPGYLQKQNHGGQSPEIPPK